MFPSPAIDLVRGKKGAQPLGRWTSRVRGLPEFYGELPVSTMAEEMETPGDGQIRAFMTICGNPVLSTPGGKRLDHLLPEMDFMVSIDNYINETSRHADVILPTPTGLEIDHYDMVFNIISVTNNAKFTQALFPIAKDRPFDWQVLTELSARIRGKATLFERFVTPRRAVALGLAFGEYGWLSHPKRWFSGLSLRKVIASEHGVGLGALRPHIPDALHTADGKVNLVPDVFLDGLAKLSQDLEKPGLRLIGRRNVSTNNSWMHQFPKLSKSRQVRCTVMIHPDDAQAHSIEDGDTVRVIGRTDSIDLPAETTDAMMPGVLSIPHGFGHTRPGTRIPHAQAKPGVSVNDITDHLCVDAVTGNAAYSGQVVQIERIASGHATRLKQGKPLTVVYGSQTGNAEALARDISRMAEDFGMVAILRDMADVTLDDMTTAHRLLVICATYGEGEMPDPARDLWQAACDAQAGAFSGVPYSVLALGDRSYTHFAKAGRDWDRQLSDLGGVTVAEVTVADADYDATAQDWADRVLPAISEQADQDVSIKAQNTGAAAITRFNRRNPAMGRLMGKRRLTADGSSKEVMHYEIAFETQGLDYTAGDTLNILPVNDPVLVAALLNEMGCEGNERIGDYHDSLRDLLTHHFEIRSPSQALLDHLGLTREDKALYGIDLLELVQSHRVQIGDMENLATLLRPLAVRSYSISSSPRAVPDGVHLTVASVRYDRAGRHHHGVGSTYLADRVSVGDGLRLYITSNTFFSLPDTARPIIMVGPGTGIAPFRGFLQERAKAKEAGKAWLFFGERQEAFDFLYRDELETWRDNGTLDRLDLAFSRDGPSKIYVQDKMREHGAAVWEWLEQDAVFYVCGDASAMAPDVEHTLLEIIRTHGQQDDPDAYLEHMRRDKRYLRDVY